VKDARSLLEALVLPVANMLEQAVSPSVNDGLVEWAVFHGWNGGADRRVVARQAALNLVLRALVYHCLSGGFMPAVVTADLVLTKSIELLRGQGIAAPPPSCLDDWAVSAGAEIPTRDLADLVDALESEPGDVIGDLYTAWVPQDARRTLGQFWTPDPIAQLMTRWAIQSADDTVLDPAFGSGVLLLESLRRLHSLGSDVIPPRQVAGVELSPLAFLMGLTNVLTHYSDARPRLQLDDFLVPKRESPWTVKEPVATYAIGARQMALPGVDMAAPTAFPEQFDAIVCNPPYTRHHHLPEAYKSSWAGVMKQEYGLKLSRFSSLFAYFFVQAARMLAPTGCMAFITPATVFEASYSRQVKAFIRQQLRLRAIITFDEALSVFDGVDTAGCITLVEGLGAPPGDTVTLVHINQWPGSIPILQAIERQDAVSSEWGNSRQVCFSELEPRHKWTVWGRGDGRWGDDRFVPLSSLARIVRGIATGANNFFVLSDREVAEWDLGQANLQPVLTKTRLAPGYIFGHDDFDRLGFEGKKRWLLDLTAPVSPGTPEARYIQHGEARGLHERSLVKTRSFWYAMEQRDPAPIYYTYLSRQRSRFIYNQTDVLALNVFLCIYPIPAVAQDETLLKALLAVLNSLASKDTLRLVGRTYGGDTVKVEPREMDRMPVLNPLALTRQERDNLASLFDQLCTADSRPAEQTIRQTIDELIAAISE
jgi:hypothetical protein